MLPDVIKQQAILDLISGHYTQEQLCDKYHMSRATLYSWQVKYIGKGDTVLRSNKPKTAEDYKKEIADLKLQKELIQKELEQAQKQIYKAQLEKDVYEKAAEILKKEMGCSLKDFSNREKAMVIAA
jgi:transposase-like protein